MCSTYNNSMHLRCYIESKGVFHDHYCNGEFTLGPYFHIRSCEGNALVVAAAMSNCWDHQMPFHQMNISSQRFLMHYLFALFYSRCQVRFIIIIITIASFCQSRAFIFRIINFPCDLILATNMLEDLEVLKVKFLYRWMSLHLITYQQSCHWF